MTNRLYRQYLRLVHPELGIVLVSRYGYPEPMMKLLGLSRYGGAQDIGPEKWAKVQAELPDLVMDVEWLDIPERMERSSDKEKKRFAAARLAWPTDDEYHSWDEQLRRWKDEFNREAEERYKSARAKLTPELIAIAVEVATRPGRDEKYVVLGERDGETYKKHHQVLPPPEIDLGERIPVIASDIADALNHIFDLKFPHRGNQEKHLFKGSTVKALLDKAVAQGLVEAISTSEWPRRSGRRWNSTSKVVFAPLGTLADAKRIAEQKALNHDFDVARVEHAYKVLVDLVGSEVGISLEADSGRPSIDIGPAGATALADAIEQLQAAAGVTA